MPRRASIRGHMPQRVQRAAVHCAAMAASGSGDWMSDSDRLARLRQAFGPKFMSATAQSLGSLARNTGMICRNAAIASRSARAVASPRGERRIGTTECRKARSSITLPSEDRNRFPSFRPPEAMNASSSICTMINSAVGSGNSSGRLGSNNAGTITTPVRVMRPTVVSYARQTRRDNGEIRASHNNVATQVLRQFDHKMYAIGQSPNLGRPELSAE
jgi:hypothetical protein